MRIKPRSEAETASELNSQLQTGEARVEKEFASAEALLRYDAARTNPPPSIMRRLKESLAREPQAARAWWKRWLAR